MTAKFGYLCPCRIRSTKDCLTTKSKKKMKSLIKALKQALHKYRVMRCSYTIHSDWKDDLIWCPSQCYKHIEYKGKQFVIYLRWRHSDPWSAEIVECIPDGNFYMHSKEYEWHYLNVSNWADTELNELKKEVEWYVKDWLVRLNL